MKETKVLSMFLTSDGDGNYHTSFQGTEKQFKDIELFMMYKHLEMVLNQSGFDWSLGQDLSVDIQLKEENK